MLSWLAENGGTIGVLVLLLLVVGGIIAGILRDRRKGKSSCGSNCSGCPMGGSCHPKK
ncbi:MAG: FeoB-associated Cys-rich membrane protein [Oscillospiraceae bacterium]